MKSLGKSNGGVVGGGNPPTAPPSPPKSPICVWPRAHITTRNETSVYARSERLCNALVATRLSAYVRSRIERLCNALVAAKHKGNALVPDYLFTWSLFLVRASIAGRLHSCVSSTGFRSPPPLTQPNAAMLLCPAINTVLLNTSVKLWTHYSSLITDPSGILLRKWTRGRIYFHMDNFTSQGDKFTPIRTNLLPKRTKEERFVPYRSKFVSYRSQQDVS